MLHWTRESQSVKLIYIDHDLQMPGYILIFKNYLNEWLFLNLLFLNFIYLFYGNRFLCAIFYYLFLVILLSA